MHIRSILKVYIPYHRGGIEQKQKKAIQYIRSFHEYFNFGLLTPNTTSKSSILKYDWFTPAAIGLLWNLLTNFSFSKKKSLWHGFDSVTSSVTRTPLWKIKKKYKIVQCIFLVVHPVRILQQTFTIVDKSLFSCERQKKEPSINHTFFASLEP